MPDTLRPPAQRGGRTTCRRGPRRRGPPQQWF